MVKALTTMCFVSVACLGQGLIRFDNFNIPTHSDPSRVYYAPIYREDFFTAARAGGAGGGLIAGLVLADSNEVIATSLFNTDSAHSPYLAEGKVVAIPGYSAGSRPTLRFRVWEWAEGWTNSRVRFETSFQTQPLGGQTQDGTSVQIPGLTGLGAKTAVVSLY